MATIDNILGNAPGFDNALKSAQEEIKQKNQTEVQPTAYEEPFSFYDYYLNNSSFKPKTKEELEKEEKRHKRNMVLARIGDGLSALHTAYARARGIDPITDSKVNLTGKVRDRYERLQKDYEARRAEWLSGAMRAKQMDMQQGNWRDNFEYQKSRAAADDKRHQEDFNFRKAEADRAQAERDRTYNYKVDRDKKEDAFRQQEINERKRQHSSSLGQQERHFQARQRREANQLRGKPMQFSDGSGSAFTIYKNVWDASWPQLFDYIVENSEPTLTGNGVNTQWQINKWREEMRKKSPSQQEAYVKSNWHKFDETIAKMKELSEIDPAGEYDGSSGTGKGTGYGNDNKGAGY